MTVLAQSTTYSDKHDIPCLLKIQPREGAVGRRTPLNVGVVLDTSGSMKDAGKFEHAVAAIQAVADMLEPGDSLNLTTFDDEAHDVAAGLKNGQQARAFLADLEPSGYTDMWGGLEKGVALLRGQSVTGRPVANFDPTAKRVMLLMSDGEVNRGLHQSTDALVAKLEPLLLLESDQKITLYAIGLGKEFNAQLIGRLARLCGTEPFHMLDAGRTQSLCRDIFTEASASVAVGLELIVEPKNGAAVTDWKGGNRSGDRVALGDLALGSVVTLTFTLDTKRLGVTREHRDAGMVKVFDWYVTFKTVDADGGFVRDMIRDGFGLIVADRASGDIQLPVLDNAEVLVTVAKRAYAEALQGIIPKTRLLKDVKEAYALLMAEREKLHALRERVGPGNADLEKMIAGADKWVVKLAAGGASRDAIPTEYPLDREMLAAADELASAAMTNTGRKAAKLEEII